VKQLLLCALVLATSCKRDEPPAPTQEQSAQLNEAEDMLNAAANKEAPVTNTDQ